MSDDTQNPNAEPGCDKCRPNDGWILRRGKGRCTTAHEYVFVLAKTDRYFWDSAAFHEKSTGNAHGRGTGVNPKAQGGDAGVEKQNSSFSAAVTDKVATRNPRSVWTIATEPSKEKHFASYPSELVRRCLQAGTSDGGCCEKCGAPYAPLVESEKLKRERPNDITKRDGTAGTGNHCGNTVAGVSNQILGYRATCVCQAANVPCRVLDPFLGTGTTIQSAIWTGRDGTGIELNDKYLAIAQRKIQLEPRWLTKQNIKPRKGRKKASHGQ